MGELRRFLQEGDKLYLGGTEYRIEMTEGFGASSVVYRASYEDQLNQGYCHKVLIKELFPFHPKGEIYRNEEGRICCTEKGNDLMDQCRISFYQGNQANLGLLERLPERISGNINSWEANGTFYSVLALHGGKSLEACIQNGEGPKSLKDMAELMLKILRAVECFHENGILHLDISPDNLLILPEQALLIDYNSVWFLKNQEGMTRYYSEKEGYCAPEVRLKEAGAIGPSADLYSICAVWFLLMTGRKLSETEAMGKGLGRCFPKNLEIFRGEPVTAAWKTVQILTKGLHILSRKRYQSVGEMRNDVKELLLRIEGRGISHSALWEGSIRSLREFKAPKEAYLDQEILLKGEEACSLQSCCRLLQTGEKILMTGPGGMGKTRFLAEIWKRSLERYAPDLPVAVYVPLADYQETKEESYYIRKYLLRHLCFFNEAQDMETALHELKRQLESQKCLRLMLLLDGLNESGESRSRLLKEIEEMGNKTGIGILLTDRSDGVMKYGLKGFMRARLLPLSERAVEERLAKEGLSYPEKEEIRELLRSPMMLSLYERSAKMTKEAGKGELHFQTMDGLIGLYLDCLSVHEQRVDSGNQAEQLRHQYLLRHFLPEIARQLKRRKRTILTREELYALTQRNYRNLSRKAFAMAFPEFMGKSRLMLKDVRNEGEWFDYGVTEQLSEHLNLIRQSGGGNYGLVHDNFIDYLARLGQDNRKALMRYSGKRMGRKGCLVLVLAALLAGGGMAVRNALMPARLTDKEQAKLRDVIYQMNRNLGSLGLQLSAQQQLLEMALKKEVLEGDADALAEFGKWVEYKKKETDTFLFGRTDAEPQLLALEKAGADMPIRLIEDLCQKTFEMEIIMEEGLEHLQKELGADRLSYSDKEEMARFYRDYLEAYGEAVYRELNMALYALEPDMAKEVLDSVSQMAVFSRYMMEYPYEGKESETLEREFKMAKDAVKVCVENMKTWGYQFHVTGWQ